MPTEHVLMPVAAFGADMGTLAPIQRTLPKKTVCKPADSDGSTVREKGWSSAWVGGTLAQDGAVAQAVRGRAFALVVTATGALVGGVRC